ncbi:phage tail tape measure protein [uncultured Bacteroides sp.]|uniref:phage tail tape measure protein n=1 Tax=uncultured Bacteroides sp. TaxID=162156 RepID=UPI0026046592|nr:phage tail tape measure protein [uncultured Bacteroides sp.]
MAKSDDRKVKRGVYLYIDGKEINNDITSIQAEIRQLTKDIKDMQIGSEEYTQTVRKIRTLRGILKEHKDTIRQVTDETKKSTLSFGRFVDGFNRFGGFIASMVASLTGLILGLRSLRDEKNKLESSQASLKALTGLDNDSISWLTQQAQVLSTTMTKEGLRVKAAANEILDAYMLVGSAKPELLSDKEALAAVTEEAMRMQAAAGDITLAQAVDALTLSLNQYGAEADQAARFTNVLAAGSKEGAANIASQTAAIRNSGVAAASANVSFEETVALIQTLAYSGIKDEVAGTALKKFFLVLQTGADDVNPKIVGLSKALENLKAKNMGAADIKDMFGEEGYNAASVILQNIDMVNRYTEAVTGTSVAQEQAAINSATAEAKLAQVRNEMKLAGIELIEKLNPAIMVSTNAMTYVIKILPGLIDWFMKYSSTVVSCSIAIAGLTAYKKVDIMYSKLQVLWNEKIVVSLKKIYVAAKTNPWGVLVLFASTYIGLLMDLKRRQDSITESQRVMTRLSKESADRYDKEASRIKVLTNMVHDNYLSYNNRIKALNELKKIVPGYNADLNDEGKLINDNTDAIRDYLTVLEKQIKLEAAREELTELYRRQMQLQRLQTSQEADVRDASSNLNAARFVAEMRSGKLNTSGTDNLYKAVDAASQQAVNRLNEANEVLDKTKKELSEVEAAIISVNKEIENNSSFVLNTNKLTDDDDDDDDDDDGTGLGTDDKNKFAAQEAEYYRQIAEIKKQYLEDSAMTQDEYNNRMLQAELKLLQDKLSIAGLEPEEQQKIMDQVLDARIKLRNAMIEQEKQEADEKKKIQEQAVQDRLDLLDRQQQMETIKLNEQYINGLIGESEYQQSLKDLALQYIEAKLQDTNLGEDKRLDLIKAKQSLEIANMNEHHNKLREQQHLYQDLITGMATQFGGILGGIMVKSEDAMKDSLKNMLLIMLDYLEKVMIMAVGEVTIRSFTDIVSSFASIAKIMAIKAAFSAVKTAISSGFADGGYTPDGPWDKPQGVVHSGEFVSNRFAVRNKHLRPVFDLIDQAQRAGSVANLTGDDIAAVVSSRSVTSSGTTKTRPEPVRKSTADPEMMAAIYGLIKVTGRLNKRLDEPFVTVNSVTGKGGIKEAMDEYDNLNSNKNRSTK